MNSQRFRRLSLAALLLCCLPLGSVDAQQQRTIRGTVTDENGGKIRGANVILHSRSGLQLSTVTDENGSFIFTRASDGEYTVEVRSEGFATVALPANRDEISVVLKPEGVSAEVVVTATGTPQRAEEVGKAISILEASEIETRHTLSLTEALRGTPGVRIQQQGSPGSLTTVRMRGQRNFDTALLLDGLRVRDASDINGSAVSLLTDLTPQALDRIEVLRGSGSSIYGTNAIGGVINLVPPSDSGPIHLDAGFEAGSLHTFRERLGIAGGSERVGYSIGLNRIDVRRGVDGEDQYGSTSGLARLQLRPTNRITVSGNFLGTVANARLNDSPIALPAAFNGQQFPRAIPSVTFQPDLNNPDEGRRNRLLVGSGKLTHQVTEALWYSVGYQRVTSHRRNYNGPGIDPQFASFYPFGDFEFVNVNNGVTDTIDARVNYALGRTNIITGGLEYERESFFQQSLPSFSAFNNTTDRQRTFAVFGQDQLSLLDERLQVSVSVRGQFFHIDAADRPGVLQGITADHSITGDGAVAYFVRSTNTKLRAHAGNGFRAPSLFERFGAGTFPGLGLTRFGDPTLKAEQSISVDGGIDQRLASDRILFGVTYFYTRLQRLIAFKSVFVDPLGLGRFSGYVNEPGGMARGVETYAETSPWRYSNFKFSYTLTNSDRAASAGGLFKEYVIPEHLFAVNFTQHYRSLLFNVDVNHTGAYVAPVFESNFPFRMAELTFSGYTKVDAYASYERRIGEGTTAVFFGGVENLTDQTYYENGFRAPGAVGRGGVKLKF